MKTNVYIDGFNLYYCSLKNTSYKWLDLRKLVGYYLPNANILEIKYFTANVKNHTDPNASVRQQIYLRALATIPNLKVILGKFLTNNKAMPVADLRGAPQRVKVKLWKWSFRLPLARRKNGKPQLITVIDTKEKGSDVNLASHLLVDGFKKAYDQAVVISDDSDLREPIRLVMNVLKLPVVILNPHSNSTKLKGTQIKRIRSGALGASQFPPDLTDSHGTFHKPLTW